MHTKNLPPEFLSWTAWTQVQRKKTNKWSVYSTSHIRTSLITHGFMFTSSRPVGQLLTNSPCSGWWISLQTDPGLPLHHQIHHKSRHFLMVHGKTAENTLKMAILNERIVNAQQVLQTEHNHLQQGYSISGAWPNNWSTEKFKMLKQFNRNFRNNQLNFLQLLIICLDWH